MTTNNMEANVPQHLIFHDLVCRAAGVTSKQMSDEPEKIPLDLAYCPQLFCHKYSLQGRTRWDFLNASLRYVKGVGQIVKKHSPQKEQRLWRKLNRAATFMSSVASVHDISIREVAKFTAFVMLAREVYPNNYSKMCLSE